MAQRIQRTGVELLGPFGALSGSDDEWAPLQGRVAKGYLHAVSATIAAGTSEMQRGIIATRRLGLPRG
jgi:alkylation response protein AidB-like acyl-CoA dehydrogenase